MFKLMDGEWHLLELFHDGLREPILSCQSFSHGTQPTVYYAFTVIESMQQRWEYMAEAPKYAQMSPTLNTSLNNF